MALASMRFSDTNQDDPEGGVGSVRTQYHYKITDIHDYKYGASHGCSSCPPRKCCWIRLAHTSGKLGVTPLFDFMEVGSCC